MKKFKRRGSVISSQLSGDEVALLRSLLSQLIEMLTDDDVSTAPAAESTESGTGGSTGEGDDVAATGPAPETDPFAAWSREFEQDQIAVNPPADPVLRRLFPNAYADDPEASAEFRRFTERDLRSKKIGDARLAIEHLDQTADGATELQIPKADADAWLRSLTSLRLALAGRLGIEDARIAEELADLPESDPRAYLASIYDWLGFAQETLISAL